MRSHLLFVVIYVVTVIRTIADTLAYIQHMQFIEELSIKQQQIFIEDSWQLPSYINMNAGMEDWHDNTPHRNGRAYHDVILAWYIGYYATMYVIMSTGPNHNDWKIVKDTEGIEILDPQHPTQRNGFIALDPRLYKHNHHLYIEHYRYQSKNQYFLFADRLYHNSSLDALYVHPSVRQFTIEHELGQMAQKNWVPFEYRANQHKVYKSSELLFVCTINPHRIVIRHSQSGNLMNMSTIALTSHTPSHSLPILWRYGEPRGGTPAKLIHTVHGNRYLTFFHSQYHNKTTGMMTYYMGAYLFQSTMPFAMTHITPDIIACKQCYNETYGLAYKVVDYILFPMGFVLRPEQMIFLSVGRNDRSMWIMKINRTALVDYMVAVDTEVLFTSPSWHAERKKEELP